MDITVAAVNDIQGAPGFKQAVLAVTFADERGSVLHRIDISTRVQGQGSESMDVIHARAVEQAKALAKQFSEA